ncbi:MAG: pyridoxamine 5'-phosphate oxidase family protein [Micromonosporaceae bacterium]
MIAVDDESYGGGGGVRVLDDVGQCGLADFRGNLQYISTGNLRGDDRVALIVMDYPNRQRLKIFGHATIHEIHQQTSAIKH